MSTADRTGISESIDRLCADLRKRAGVDPHYFDEAPDKESPISRYFLFRPVKGYLAPEDEQPAIDWARRGDKASRHAKANADS